jgi:hypothetical protein
VRPRWGRIFGKSDKFVTFLDITVHTRPDGDLEILGTEKCIARDLKIVVLDNPSHGVLDLVALTCLTS